MTFVVYSLYLFLLNHPEDRNKSILMSFALMHLSNCSIILSIFYWEKCSLKPYLKGLLKVTSTGCQTLVQFAGTNMILVLEWLFLSHVRNSLDLCTNQQSMIKMRVESLLKQSFFTCLII